MKKQCLYREGTHGISVILLNFKKRSHEATAVKYPIMLQMGLSVHSLRVGVSEFKVNVEQSNASSSQQIVPSLQQYRTSSSSSTAEKVRCLHNVRRLMLAALKVDKLDRSAQERPKRSLYSTNALRGLPPNGIDYSSCSFVSNLAEL